MSLHSLAEAKGDTLVTVNEGINFLSALGLLSACARLSYCTAVKTYAHTLVKTNSSTQIKECDIVMWFLRSIKN